MSNVSAKVRNLVGIGIFAALVIVLQIVATFVKFGPFSITLALTPIVVGAAFYGSKAGAWLGGVFGVVVLLMCIFGADVGGAILWNVNPIMTALLCIVKGVAAGWIAGLVYRAFRKKNVTLSVILSAIVSPIVNTGIFCIAMVLIYRSTLIEWAGGADLAYYVFAGLIGINFLVEMFVNVVLSPVAARIIRVGQRKTA
jgi:uncharacterized membrane protein